LAAVLCALVPLFEVEDDCVDELLCGEVFAVELLLEDFGEAV
jgi:hypothetical protein